MSIALLSYARTGAAALVIERPERRTAVDGTTAAQLAEALDRFAAAEGRGGHGVADG